MSDPIKLASTRSTPATNNADSEDNAATFTTAGASTDTPISTDNLSAFAHNASFPPAISPTPAIPDHLRNVPDFTLRKPSATGLHLHTGIVKPGQHAVEDATGHPSRDLEGHDSTQEQTRFCPGPLVVSRSWESNGGGSPSSITSSASLGPLGDVTPLPSPIVPTWSPDIWKRVATRPHSSSNASIDRDKAAGLLSPVPQNSPPKKKKGYGGLNGSPPPSNDNNGTPERIRALSDFVPEPLVNIKPRIVTGPLSVALPPPSVPLPQDQKSPLHREQFRAKARKSVDVSKALDPASLLPSPPVSTHTPSEEEDDTGLSFVTIKDATSKQVTHWKTLRQLGTGSFSKVVLATPDIQAGSMDSAISGLSAAQMTLVAIKIVSHNPPGDEDEERMDTSIHREIELLQTVSHPSLPRLFAFENTESQAYLVLNYCPGGDLFDLASQQREHVTPLLIQRMFAELVDATSYLHGLLIVHRDIKLENVLINVPLHSIPTDPTTYSHPLVTLTDLGLSKHLPPPPESPLLTHPCGSVDYAAPELLLGQPYDGRATDAWALGVLLYALMEGRLPFDPVPNGRRRGTNNVKHRIARCDWLWCEYGDEFGDWKEDTARAEEMEGAREIVEGLLKKVGRGRWSLDKVKSCQWVTDGMKVDGGLRVF